MSIRIAINGFGRIGRNVLRALYEHPDHGLLKVVAINDTGSIQTHAHLLQYDTTHGRFQKPIRVQGHHLVVHEDPIHVTSERNPQKLPWKQLDIDLVLECTGVFTTREKAAQHLSAGAKRVMISAPASTPVDATTVYGVNHHLLKASDTIISNASCTTNCLAPLVKPLHEQVGICQGLMTTIHAVTNDQVLTDANHKDLRRARAATQSMIPTKTGAAAAVGLVIPELNGKLDGFAVRVPVLNVSVVDLTFQAAKATSVSEVNNILKTASQSDALKNILAYNDQPLVSVDFNHHSASCIFDATQTKVMGTLVKVLGWYDNEWGFSHRMLDVAKYWCTLP